MHVHNMRIPTGLNPQYWQNLLNSPTSYTQVIHKMLCSPVDLNTNSSVGTICVKRFLY